MKKTSAAVREAIQRGASKPCTTNTVNGKKSYGKTSAMNGNPDFKAIDKHNIKGA